MVLNIKICMIYINNIYKYKLNIQCSKVGYSSYKINWYHLPEKTALDLKLIINISHHPIKITAGKIINLSFSSFGNVSINHYHLQEEKT